MPLLSMRVASGGASGWQDWETHQRFMLQVDWAGDGSFLGGNVNADVIGPVQCVRGRDYASQLSGRSVAGQLTATLRNDDGRYSSFNAASPLYGFIRPGLKVRASALAPYNNTLWTGKLDTLEPQTGGEPRAVLRASGILKQLGDQSNLVSVAPITNGLVSDAVDDVLDAAGHPTAARDIETSAVPLAHWFAENKPALVALQELEETEIGFLYEDLNFGIAFDSRYHRNILAPEGSSLVGFGDDVASNTPYIALVQNEAVRDIYNHMTAEVTTYEAAALGVLWNLPASSLPYLGPGESIGYTATYTAGYVNPWTTPDPGTDVVGAGGTLAVSGVVKSGQNMSFVITNSHASQGSTLSLVQARGVAYTAGESVQIKGEDATSQAKYGKRSYPLSSPWYPNAAYAQAAVDYFISLRKDPHPVLTVTIPSGANPTGSFIALAEQGANRALSDRVTVRADSLLTMLGIDGVDSDSDFFIESIAHVFGPHGTPWTTTFMLSPRPEEVGTNYWLLGHSTWGQLGITTRLAY